MQQVLFQGGRDGGLARGREPGEPDREALLLAEFAALLSGQRRVPDDVAI